MLKYEEFWYCRRFEPLSAVVGGDGSVHCATTTARKWTLTYVTSLRRCSSWLSQSSVIVLFEKFEQHRLANSFRLIFPSFFCQKMVENCAKGWGSMAWKLALRLLLECMWYKSYVIRGSTNSHGRDVPARTRGHRMGSAMEVIPIFTLICCKNMLFVKNRPKHKWRSN